MLLAAVLILLGVLVACADSRRSRQRRIDEAVRRLQGHAPRKPVASAGYADYSRFDQDRILANRSERWE